MKTQWWSDLLVKLVVKISEDRWFEAGSASTLLCCFVSLLHIVSLCLNRTGDILAGDYPAFSLRDRHVKKKSVERALYFSCAYAGQKRPHWPDSRGKPGSGAMTDYA